MCQLLVLELKHLLSENRQEHWNNKHVWRWLETFFYGAVVKWMGAEEILKIDESRNIFTPETFLIIIKLD